MLRSIEQVLFSIVVGAVLLALFLGLITVCLWLAEHYKYFYFSVVALAISFILGSAVRGKIK